MTDIPSYRSLQPLKENIHPLETYIFLLLFLWVIFALLDPDPDLVDQNNADPLEKTARIF
jgi:hypothetical protein